MTREEAIEVLKDIYNYTRFDTYTTNEARTMAIKALKQEPCGDCVSRQAVLDEVRAIAVWHTGDAFNEDRILTHMKMLSPVTPQREQGEWIGVNPMVDTLMCSKCGENIISEEFKSKYCPNCGAKMVEPQESEDRE